MLAQELDGLIHKILHGNFARRFNPWQATAGVGEEEHDGAAAAGEEQQDDMATPAGGGAEALAARAGGGNELARRVIVGECVEEDLPPELQAVSAQLASALKEVAKLEGMMRQSPHPLKQPANKVTPPSPSWDIYSALHSWHIYYIYYII